MSKDSNLQQAVEILEDSKLQILPLLKDLPSLQIRVENTFSRLIAGFTNMDGISSQNGNATEKLQPMKTFMGNVIGENTIASVKPVEKAEVADLLANAQKIYGTVMDRDSKELLEAIPEVELRAVAKLAGLHWVTSAMPPKVSVKFVDQIKAGIEKKEQLAKEQKIEDRSIILKDLKFVHDAEAKTWTLDDKVVTEEQILDDEFFDGVIASVKPVV